MSKFRLTNDSKEICHIAVFYNKFSVRYDDDENQNFNYPVPGHSHNFRMCFGRKP